MTDAKPYTLAEASILTAYHGAPATKCPLDDNRFYATVEALERAEAALAAVTAERDALRKAVVNLEDGAISVELWSERAVMEAIAVEMLNALREQVATLTRERDEARADATRKGEALNALLFMDEMVKAFDYMRKGIGTATDKGKALLEARAALADTTSADWLAERLAAQREACATVAYGVFTKDGKYTMAEMGPVFPATISAIRNTPLVNGGDSWLAVRDAATRDAALEEAADFIDNTERWPDGSELRALKRGGK